MIFPLKVIEIDAPFLISLKITSYNLKKMYFLKNLSLVTKATLDFEGAGDFSYTTNYGVMNVVEIINSLGHVKHLQLSRLCIMVSSLSLCYFSLFTATTTLLKGRKPYILYQFFSALFIYC